MKKAVIFDLDGVIVSTDMYHYDAWTIIADEEGIPFDEIVNNRLRGVSRIDSLEIILEGSTKTYTDDEKHELASRKNTLYSGSLESLTPDAILPGVGDTLRALRLRGVKLAIGSSSRNTPKILERIGLGDYFDAVADGNQIVRSKPDPEVFLLAARLLGIPPEECAVIEDAVAGIDAAKAGGMRAVGVGDASDYGGCDVAGKTLKEIPIDKILD